MYAIGGSAEPTINSQGNRYLAPVNPFAKEVYTVLQYGEFRIKFLHHSNKEFLTSYWIWWIRYDQVTKRVDTAEGQWKGWNWRSEGDLMLNGAYFTPSGAGASASYARASSLGAKSSSMVGTITSGAGVLGCRRGHQCWLCPPSPTISKTKRSLFFFLAPFFAFFRFRSHSQLASVHFLHIVQTHHSLFSIPPLPYSIVAQPRPAFQLKENQCYSGSGRGSVVQTIILFRFLFSSSSLVQISQPLLLLS